MFSSVQEEVQHYVSGIQVIFTMMVLVIFWSFIIINKIIIIARRTMDYFKAPQQSSSQSLPDRSLTRMEGAACDYGCLAVPILQFLTHVEKKLQNS